MRDIHDCNGCADELAKKLGPKFAVVAWAQKVRNLILDLTIWITDAQTGRVVRGGSVDIRGNTDESWKRGLNCLQGGCVHGARIAGWRLVGLKVLKSTNILI